MFESVKILTIDDSSTIRNYLRTLLAPLCAGVEGASTGQEGLEKCETQEFDLILLDLLLPDTSGLDVLKRIRSANETCAVVMLTGEGGISSATAALQRGADGYIEKQDVVSGDHAAFFYALEKAIERRGALVAQKRLQAEIAEKVEQLRVSEKKAQDASRAKSTFLASMSHELRTPLNAILGFIQLMERDPTLNRDQREHLAIIARSGEHLLALINDILSLSKIEAGLLTLNDQAFDLHRMLQSLEEMFRQRSQAKFLQLLVERSPGMPQFVHGDDGKLRQVLINLLGNAVKFTESGGVGLRVRWIDGICAFEVQDTGHGISEDELTRLFEPFVQTQSGQKSKEGTGLGLAISRNFVKLMGGHLHVKSQVSQGTVFSFEVALPRAEGADVPREERKVIGIEPGQPTFRILVVDDKWENRALLVKLLTSVGFTTREAADGKEAVRVWEQWNPHLIWMDMRMPVMDGYDATRYIRELGLTGGNGDVEEAMAWGAAGAGANGGHYAVSPKIIALTASAFEQDREATIQAGCDDFVAKPFREATIFDKMAEHLGVRYLYDESHDPAPGDPTIEAIFTPGRLRTLPLDWLLELNDAVIQGDVEAAFEVANKIGSRDEPLANELRGMIRDYKFDEIQQMVEHLT